MFLLFGSKLPRVLFSTSENNTLNEQLEKKWIKTTGLIKKKVI
ncbi:hypothetical protein FFR91_05720 [Mycoplasma mycoides subsp. mycoides]|uniref:Uncharacterized protein n=1 Tax=Mycoplasma mycoides subsp. mycoides SC (strain CCUG 32753 / NCTC 10114 / PG1) TaxID=272632 RepID=Q6MRT3_MYCMS|nr:hypothetical protein MSCe_0760 [Mycoplasma mycoides subsp. mycoides str. Gemu Goffa]TNJ30811.1 hypothetical protein FFR90_05720 [Mycoplasma mycoides subsp. mycoides]TNJ30980.1 hypothetical protein FFR91_05720 [Mycoplasma mycoides subsp. mycoides]CAE77635.1 Hypothetical protein MSC_1029 [Mycoplasma mycoides subsp. mycoides SC str. PG1]CAE77658.1 Hypothetical protein MSC_1054 [Mycoplasma mycoides subsp. mycoides SC str. PG1]